MAEALRRLIAEHPDVRVECIGVDLKLGERYRHDLLVAFRELQGGRLVPDDGWFEALEPLVTHRRERRRLARKARAWAKRHTIDAVADRWEELFADTAAVAGARR